MTTTQNRIAAETAARHAGADYPVLICLAADFAQGIAEFFGTKNDAAVESMLRQEGVDVDMLLSMYRYLINR